MKLSILCTILLVIFLAFSALSHHLTAQTDPSVTLAEPLSVAMDR